MGSHIGLAHNTHSASAHLDDVTGVLGQLARAGYARTLRVRHGRVWCSSCESAFEEEDLVVDVEIAINRRGESAETIVYGLRCVSCGAKGAWMLTNPRADEQELISRLRRADSMLGGQNLVT